MLTVIVFPVRRSNRVYIPTCGGTRTRSKYTNVVLYYSPEAPHAISAPFRDVMRDQPTVIFPTGDHVNVLHDYKKTGPSKILKLLTCRCHAGRVLSKSHISNSFKMAERAIPVHVYQFLHELQSTCALYVAKKLPTILPPTKII